MCFGEKPLCSLNCAIVDRRCRPGSRMKAQASITIQRKSFGKSTRLLNPIPHCQSKRHRGISLRTLARPKIFVCTSNVFRSGSSRWGGRWCRCATWRARASSSATCGPGRRARPCPSPSRSAIPSRHWQVTHHPPICSAITPNRRPCGSEVSGASLPVIVSWFHDGITVSPFMVRCGSDTFSVVWL